MAGSVKVNQQVCTKPGQLVKETETIELKESLPYVSRGGLKLEKGLAHFELSPVDWLCADIGCSHGGFTDCLLQKGAKAILAIDAGIACLDYKLQKDSRVMYHPRSNFRYFDSEPWLGKIDLVTVDVSFISIRYILEKISAMLKKQGHVLALIKPQFEVGKEEVEKGGVVRDRKKHDRVLAQITAFSLALGLENKGFCPSPIVGKKKGNQEFLMHLIKP